METMKKQEIRMLDESTRRILRLCRPEGDWAAQMEAIYGEETPPCPADHRALLTELLAALYCQRLPDAHREEGLAMAGYALESVADFSELLSAAMADDRAPECFYTQKLTRERSPEEADAICRAMEAGLAAFDEQAAGGPVEFRPQEVDRLMEELEGILRQESGPADSFPADRSAFRAITAMVLYLQAAGGDLSCMPAGMRLDQVAAMVCARDVFCRSEAQLRSGAISTEACLHRRWATWQTLRFWLVAGALAAATLFAFSAAALTAVPALAALAAKAFRGSAAPFGRMEELTAEHLQQPGACLPDPVLMPTLSAEEIAAAAADRAGEDTVLYDPVEQTVQNEEW